MSWTTQPARSFFKLILAQDSDTKIGGDIGIFYIGLGDRFDDDRRFVRETTPVLWCDIGLAQRAGSATP